MRRAGSGSGPSDRLISVPAVMEKLLHVNRKNARGFICKGLVSIDGVPIGLTEMELPLHALQGRVICCGHRKTRMGSRRENQEPFVLPGRKADPEAARLDDELTKQLELG